MHRVLDLDLDFFLDGVAHWIRYDGNRLDGGEYPPWPTERVMAFLEERCGLSGGLPGFVVERHAELFARWRQAIDAGLLTPPFSVTHVDAHADLGLGDAGYVHLMSELLFKPVEERCFPKTGASGLDDGNWVSFAVGCRWIGELTYVFNTTEPHPGDILPYVMEGFNPYADHLQLPAVRPTDIHALTTRLDKAPIVHHYEPKVPFRALPWGAFQATQPFDVVCLIRSPAFTPVASDALFEEIRARFIDEAALGGSSAGRRI